jgi:hypothetical protein
MTTLLELMTPVILRVDAADGSRRPTTRSAAWLEELGPRPRTLEGLCGCHRPEASSPTAPARGAACLTSTAATW